MAVDLRKEDDGDRLPVGASPAGPPAARGWELPDHAARFVSALWSALWILAFATTHWEIGLVMLFLTAPVTRLAHGGRSSRERRRRRHQLHAQRRREALQQRERARLDPAGPAGDPQPAAPPRPAAAPSTTSAAERSLAATVVRAETSAARLDPDALSLVREVDQLLRPLLASVRARGADARVRHDLEAIASQHLPEVLDAYLRLPTDYAHDHRSADGTTPADALRSQLTLLVEGCRQLRDAVHDADVGRQQELSRFLDAKFRRSDLDL